MTETPAWNKYVAELFGTFVLVFLGSMAILATGAGVLTGGAANAAYVVVALAFGIGLMAAFYTFGHVSGGHFNPAVTVGMWLSKRITLKDGVPYIVCQVIGAVLASAMVYVIWAANGTPAATITGPAGIGATTTSWAATWTSTGALIAEILMTMVFVWVILTATGRNANPQWAGLVIGMTLVGIHLAALGLTGSSVNPARSTGPALLAQGAALTNLWVYWVAPIVGGILGAVVHRFVVPEAPLVSRRAMEIPA